MITKIFQVSTPLRRHVYLLDLSQLPSSQTFAAKVCLTVINGPPEIGKNAERIRAIAVRMPASQQTVNVRIGVAAGGWENVAESMGHGGYTGGGKEGVVFSPAQEKDGSVSISVAYNITGCEVYLTAVGTDGRGHSASTSQSGNTGGNLVQVTATFAKFSLKDIKGFRLVKRPYEWIEVRNVSLQPGKKTDVQVSLPAASAAGPFRF